MVIMKKKKVVSNYIERHLPTFNINIQKLREKILKKHIKPKNRGLIIKSSKKVKLKLNIKYEYSLNIKNNII